MTIRLFLLATACAGIALASISFSTWQSASKNRQKLEAAIAAQQQRIAQLDTQEDMRSVTLKAATDKIETLKRKVNTPGEAVRDLPHYMQLPDPITPIPPDESGERSSNASAATQPFEVSSKPAAPVTNVGEPPSSPSPHSNGFYLPTADAKPLFDFVQSSRLCDLQLSSARSDLQDERAKSTDLARERDQAVRATKGESAITRLKRDAKWLLIGAAMALAASPSHRIPQKQ
jgi:hypothetical protein